MDLLEIKERLEAEGYVIDEGNLIAGPFIPDGRCRIYDPTSMHIVAEGRTVEKALLDCPTSEEGWQLARRYCR